MFWDELTRANPIHFCILLFRFRADFGKYFPVEPKHPHTCLPINRALVMTDARKNSVCVRDFQIVQQFVKFLILSINARNKTVLQNLILGVPPYIESLFQARIIAYNG